MPTPTRPFWFPLISIIAVFFISSMLLGMLGGLLPDSADNTFVNFIVYVGSMLATIAYAASLHNTWQVELPSFHPKKWRFNPRLVLFGLLLMLSTGIVLTPLLEQLPEKYIEQLDSYMQGGLWPMMTAVIAAPILEEFLFRGIIQKNLVSRLGPLWGILLGSLIFGAIHLIPQQIIYAGCLGVILGTIYHLTGALNDAIAVHFVNNGLTSLLYLVFGTSGSLERKLLGEGTLWTAAYILALLILGIGVLYAVLRIRKSHAQTADNTPDCNEN